MRGAGVPAWNRVLQSQMRQRPALTLDTLAGGKASVVGFVFGKSGLLAGWSAKSMKFTKIGE